MTIILGFDFGQKRTGVAIAIDGDVQPLATIDTDTIYAEIPKLISKHNPSELVVGIPHNLDGGETSQTKLSRAFGEQLASLTKLPVKYQDETLSSQRALQRIGENTPISSRKKILDQVSAQIILEDYLQ